MKTVSELKSFVKALKKADDIIESEDYYNSILDILQFQERKEPIPEIKPIMFIQTTSIKVI